MKEPPSVAFSESESGYAWMIDLGMHAINKPSCIPIIMGSFRTCSTMLKSASLEKSVSVLRRRADFRDSISRMSSNLVNDNDDDNDDDNYNDNQPDVPQTGQR